MRRPSFLVLASSFWFLVSCGDSDGPAGSPDPRTSRETFCRLWAETSCNDLVIDRCVAKTPEHCLNAQHEFCRLRAPSNGWANTPYDLGEAQTCLDYVERALEDASLTPEEWDTIRLMEGACGSLFPGLGEDGGGNSGSSPVVIRNGGQTCDGPSDVCSTGYYCREDVKICAELPGEGNVCVDGVPSCREDLRCVDLDGTSVCQARYQKGDDCLVNDDCLSGLCSDTGGDGVCVDDIDISVNAPVCEYFR